MLSKRILLKLLALLSEMKRPDAPWPRKIVHDTAHLFIPFAFAVFLLLLGGALLITWGRLSNAVLVGFCVTAGILIGGFVICHLALYCTSMKEKADFKHTDDSGSSPRGSVLDARSVKVGSPRVCRSCLGGLSVHVPAVATFGGIGGRLEPVIEETSEEDEQPRPARPEPYSQQTQLAPTHEHAGGVPTSPSRPGHNQRTQQRNTDTVEDELRTRFSRPMSHISAVVAPLNVNASRPQRSSKGRGSFYAFQHPPSPHPDGKGGPGILIPSRSEQVNRPGLATSSTSPAVLNNNTTLVSSAAPSQPNGLVGLDEHRAQLSTSRSILTASQPQNPLPRTPPPHSTPTASQGRTQQPPQPHHQQTAPKIGSPLRQSHQYPYSPRDFTSPSPYSRPRGPRAWQQARHESEQLSRISTTTTTTTQQRRTNASIDGLGLGEPTSRQRPSRLDGVGGAQRSHLMLNNNFRSPSSPSSPSSSPPAVSRPANEEETHVVRFREPDLAVLIARGVIKVNPASGPPEWMLLEGRCASGCWPSSYSSAACEEGVINIYENGERRTVEVRECGGTETIRRERSWKAMVESVGVRRCFSNDSGYYTASSGLLTSSTVGRKMGRKLQQGEECSIWGQDTVLPPLWSSGGGCWASSASSEGHRRVLRRRISVPELSSRFRLERNYGLEPDDEGDLGEEEKEQEEEEGYMWEEMSTRRMMAPEMETRRRAIVRSVSSIDSSGDGRDVV